MDVALITASLSLTPRGYDVVSDTEIAAAVAHIVLTPASIAAWLDTHVTLTTAHVVLNGSGVRGVLENHTDELRNIIDEMRLLKPHKATTGTDVLNSVMTNLRAGVAQTPSDVDTEGCNLLDWWQIFKDSGYYE